MKRERPVVLQSRIVMPDLVHRGEERPQAIGLIKIPMANLVFLRVEILLASRPHWTALEQLECRAIDAVVRAQRGRQQVTDHKSRAAPRLQKCGENIGRVRPLAGAKELT